MISSLNSPNFPKPCEAATVRPMLQKRQMGFRVIMKIAFGSLAGKWQKQDLNYAHLLLNLRNLGQGSYILSLRYVPQFIHQMERKEHFSELFWGLRKGIQETQWAQWLAYGKYSILVSL